MLVQTPSKIYKADLATWEEKNTHSERIILTPSEPSKNLLQVREIIISEGGNFEMIFSKNTSIILLPLFGKIIVNQFINPISAGQSVTIKNEQNIKIDNHLKDEKADVLIFELKSSPSESSFIINDLDFSPINELIPISNAIETRNFIGIFEGRTEREIPLNEGKNQIFGMVINGAFEFQNRLLETRDAILLSEIDTLEFEALSNNALLLFFEI